jgi:hypothetical protein
MKYFSILDKHKAVLDKNVFGYGPIEHSDLRYLLIGFLFLLTYSLIVTISLLISLTYIYKHG